MSATLADDSILVSHFGVSYEKLTQAITPSSANDIGDRLIITPQELNPSITDSGIKEKLLRISAEHNVVVIVPSTWRAKFWVDVAKMNMLTAKLESITTALTTGYVGLVVLINRYDGIDLPDKACELLVIDGLPDVRTEFEKIQEECTFGMDQILNDKIHKVEQGMGRGVRSVSDHCAIILMGKTLVHSIYIDGAMNKFSDATKLQFEFSEAITHGCKQKPLDEIFKLVDYVFDRDLSWVTTSKQILSDAKYTSDIIYNPLVLSQYKAFNAAELNNFQQSSEILSSSNIGIADLFLKGWLKQRIATYENFFDKVKSQETQKSALADNRYLLKPVAGITFSKVLAKIAPQSNEILNHIERLGLDENKFILKVEKLIDQLECRYGTSSVFEEAIKEVGNFLGFNGSRPESEYGDGPDDLWAVGEKHYFVIECKNGSTTGAICKHDCNQLNGSIIWFDRNYMDKTLQVVPIMIHNSTMFEHACSPHENIRIMSFANLADFKKNLMRFSLAAVSNGNFHSPKKISELLHAHNLTPETLITKYTSEFRVK